MITCTKLTRQNILVDYELSITKYSMITCTKLTRQNVLVDYELSITKYSMITCNKLTRQNVLVDYELSITKYSMITCTKLTRQNILVDYELSITKYSMITCNKLTRPHHCQAARYDQSFLVLPIFSELSGSIHSHPSAIQGHHPSNLTSISNKQTNNDLLEKDGGTKNCIFKD